MHGFSKAAAREMASKSHVNESDRPLCRSFSQYPKYFQLSDPPYSRPPEETDFPGEAGLRADGLGVEGEVTMDDWVDVGVFGSNGQLQYLEKHKIKSGRNEIHVVVGDLPTKAGIDPLNKLIDRVSDDNTIAVKEATAPDAATSQRALKR